MRLGFTARSWGDYPFWQMNDKRMVRRINDLIKDIQREPFDSIGKPEPLKHQLIACRYHY
jgi:toxin YoeB